MGRLVLVALTLALAAVLLAGCGAHPKGYTKADTEGLDLAAGGLKYQVQQSRELNPTLTEDREVLRGLPPHTKRPGKNEVWFGIWLRVENDGPVTHTSSDNFEITDAEDNQYHPVELDAHQNILAYQSEVLGPDELYPDLDTAAAQCCARQGAVLVFRLDRSVYENRPLEFEILSRGIPERTQATLELDL